MNRLGVILLLSITLGSAVLGVAAAEVNYRILPLMPTIIQLGQEANGTTPRIEALENTTLTTAILELFPRPHIVSTPQTEFKQGDIMGIVLNFWFVWDEKALLCVTGHSLIEGNDEFIYFGETALSAHFVTTLEMYGPEGELVADSDDIRLWGGGGSSGPGLGQSSRRRYVIEVPYSWEPGTYTLKAYVEDLVTTLNDSEETTVDIVIGPPKEEPHPSPIAMKPEDMIIGLEDLPDGWTIVWENPNWTILEGCVSSFGRYFRKTVGNVTEDFDVRVIQYENIDVANESFNGKLEGARKSEEYGHDEVVILNVGDDSFLRGWPTGSSIIFRKKNIVVVIVAPYNDEAVSQGIYLTNEELIEFVMIQEAKISP